VVDAALGTIIESFGISSVIVGMIFYALFHLFEEFNTSYGSHD
jgi:hypothetical protein